ncbi:MAG: rhodanese-like domain-containing protein [bacterium]
MIKRALLLILASGLIGLTANSLSPNGVRILGPVAPAPIEGVRAIDLEGAWGLFQGRQAVFVDARTREEYDAGSIPGALSLSADEFEEKASAFLDLVPLDATVIVYCSGKGCDSSREVAELLRESGYRDIRLFYGGWEEWKRSGHPLAADGQAPPDGGLLSGPAFADGAQGGGRADGDD